MADERGVISDVGHVRSPAVAAWFADDLEQFADATALMSPDGEVLSYRQLAVRADAFAQRLGPERRLLVLECRNDIEAIVAYLGALRGRHPVILTAAGHPADLARLVEGYAPGAIYSADDDHGWSLSLPDTFDLEIHTDLAVMLSTSGTTGATKLVRLSRDNIDANARSIATYLELDDQDRAITTLPFHYSYGLSVVNSHLAVGASLALTNDSVIDDSFWRFFEHAGATSLAGVPYTFQLLDRIGFADRAIPSLRSITQAGGRLPPETTTRYAAWSEARGVRFFVMYGQTEATARMAYMPPDLLSQKPGAIGIAIPGGRFQLHDEQGVVIDATDTTGELIYSGPNVMMGYAQQPSDLGKGAVIDALRTGDLAQRDADGMYRIVGRKSRFSKLFGLRIALDEVEGKLSAHGLSGVAAGDDEVIAVAVIGDADPVKVRRMLADDYGLPVDSFWVTVADRLPVLSSGKIDYRTILSNARSERAATPEPVVRDVRELFRMALPGRTITSADSFMSLGGDSLAFVSVLSKLDDMIGILPEGWEELSVAELQVLVNGRATKGASPFAWRSVSTDMVLRAGAICWVVLHHSLGTEIGGGLDILLLLMGFSMMRFQRERLLSPNRWQIAGEVLYKIILPYWIILGTYALIVAAGPAVQIDPPTIYDFLLVSNLTGRPPWTLFSYWFFSGYMQVVLAILILMSLPAVRRALEKAPLRCLLKGVALTIALKVGAMALFGHDEMRGHTPDQFLYLPVLGAALYYARDVSQRLGLFALVVLIGALSYVPHLDLWRGGLVGPLRGVTLIVGAGLLLFVRQLQMPAIGRRLIVAVASASFVIYLSHPILRIGVRELQKNGTLPNGFMFSIIIGAVVLLTGLVISNLWDRCALWMNRRVQVLPPALMLLLGREV